KYFKNTTLGMVGVFSSMLNVFLLFTNTFLRFLFFLAGLIPQLLQKSQAMLAGLFAFRFSLTFQLSSVRRYYTARNQILS
ncbi:MAG: hypothetical protein J6R92_03035, partial [Akkermansia sp.]|nr:hypothetical protein [Akkermansia sp.]